MTPDLAPLTRIARAAAILAVIACSGDTSRGNADASDSTDAASDGSSGDAPVCNVPECFRPINCRLSCSGPIVASGCCPCMPPSFDDLCCGADACGPI